MSKSQMDICRNLQGVPVLDAKMEGTQNSQNNLEKIGRSFGVFIPHDCKIYYKAIVIKALRRY
jgi:hypothetical protein